jgi:spermidine synthase
MPTTTSPKSPSVSSRAPQKSLLQMEVGLEPRYQVAGLLLLSGMCALVFQVVWLKEFRLVFGGSTPASAAVLAVFMGGLGLGNAILGRRVDLSTNPLRMYATLELLISLTALASPWITDLVRSIYVATGGQQTLGLTGASLARLLLTVVVLGLPTFLMGGTLPAAARAITSADDRGRRDVGLLYGLNTLGAVLGVVVSTFFLLERFGGRTTLLMACGINVFTAASAWALSRGAANMPNSDEREDGSTVRSNAKANRRKESVHENPVDTPAGDGDDRSDDDALTHSIPPTFYYAAAGVIGFAFFLMELVWYRMLGPILGGSTFTFGLILAVALAGIGIGGALYPVLYRDRTPALRDLAFTCGWEALAIAIPFALGDRLAVLAEVLRGLSVFGFSGQVIGWAAIAIIVVFPAAVVAGVQFPVLIALIGSGRKDVGKQLGQAFAWNTVGAMVGSLAGGFGLLPMLTATGAWIAVVVLLVLLGGACLALIYRRERGLLSAGLPLLVMGLALVCLTATGPTSVWRHSGVGAGRSRLSLSDTNSLIGWMHESRNRTIWQADGRESAVAIVALDGASFIVNGKSDGNSITDAPTQIMLGVLGNVLHPEPKQGLVIGLGTGESAGWMAHGPTMERVDVVELEPEIDEMARLCAPLNQNVLSHPKVRRIYNDAREVLLTTPDRYDLIASEPSNPYRAGVSSLYTQEFYQAVAQRLNEGGLFLQWMQGYEIDTDTARTVMASLQSVFPHVEIWESKPSDLLLVCSTSPIRYDVAAMRRRISHPQMQESLLFGWLTDDLEGVLAHFVANQRLVKQIASQRKQVNTDDHNLLEYAFARTVGKSGSFNVNEVRGAAYREGLDKPDISGGDIDWEKVDRQRIASYALFRSAPVMPDSLSQEVQDFARAMTQFEEQTPTGFAAAWKNLKRQPDSVIELAMAAHGLAATGDPDAPSLVERLAKSDPHSARVLRTVLLAKEANKADETKALQALAEAEKTFLELRERVPAFPQAVRILLPDIIRLVERYPNEAPKLHEALVVPFAVRMIDAQRKATLLYLGKQTGIVEWIEALDAFEPNPPWNREFLEMRVSAYKAAEHPLLPRAEDDLRRFEANAPDRSVLIEVR